MNIRIAILLCTYNGEKFLYQQLDSYLEQSKKNFVVYVSDDGSEDRTIDIIKSYCDKLKIHLFSGPRKGFAQNFLSLIINEEVYGDYFAFSDQDDIWEKDKLERAINIIQQYSIHTPVLYCSRMSLISEDGDLLGLSPEYVVNPSFQNSLVESISCGNSMVFNKAARDIIKECSTSAIIPSHDWWAYIVITGCGGIVVLDNQPTVKYRQHTSNLVGMDYSMRAKLSRFSSVLQGQWQALINLNVIAIKNIEHRLTPRNDRIFKYFHEGRNSKNLIVRLSSFYRSGIYKKSFVGNLTLAISAVFNKL